VLRSLLKANKVVKEIDRCYRCDVWWWCWM